MTGVPRLLADKRRRLALLLALLALAEALFAVLFAAALDRLLAGSHPPLMALLAAAGCAIPLGASLLLARWVGEDFAQSYVADCRAAIFAEVVRSAERQPAAKSGADARWLSVLLNDMAALRNYALRGTVRLWTSALAGGAAAGWIALTAPALRPALLPLLLAASSLAMVLVPLTRAIAAQRGARGRLNRFLIRRVRAELAGQVSPKGHGLRRLAVLSDALAQASVRRARRAGGMDALVTLAGLTAAVWAVWAVQAGGEAGAQASAQASAGGSATIAGALSLLGFVAARLLEASRALHARASGRIALLRLEQLLQPDPGHLVRSVLRVWASRWRQRAASVLAFPDRPARLAPPPRSPRSPCGQEPGA